MIAAELEPNYKDMIEVAVRTYNQDGLKIAITVYRTMFNQLGDVYFRSSRVYREHFFAVPRGSAVLFVQTAEQHIKRFRAQSKIATQALLDKYLENEVTK